jgi:molybdenum cofactor cytidylyltransferase
VKPHITAIVLAAGGSTRMGGAHKLLCCIGGEPLVRRAARAALESACDRVIVVTGAAAARVEAALAGLAVTLVRNEDWRDGLSSSLRSGLVAAGSGPDGALVHLADMPAIGARDIDRLIEAFDPCRPCVVVPVRQGRRGNPVLWPRGRFEALLELRGDAGARELLRREQAGGADSCMRAVEFDHDGIFDDVDTPGQMDQLRLRLE